MVGMAPALGVSQMACSSSSTCSLTSRAAPSRGSSRTSRTQWATSRRCSLRVRAAGEKVEECNEEECAPTKEVGKLSMSWEAEEKTKVTGTFPPLARQERKWTGYVEKDTAGQTNIYSVEPVMYVSDSPLSSNAGSSAEGAENYAAVAGGLAVIAIAAASSVLLSVGKNIPTPVDVAVGYSGPTLSYYIAKFTPEVAVTAAVEASSQAAPEVSTPAVEEGSAADIAAEAVDAAISTPVEDATA